MFAQICADILSVRIEDITAEAADTGLFPLGSGAIASQTAVTAGSSVHQASSAVQRQRGDQQASERMLAQAAELAIRKSAPNKMVTVANAYVEIDNLTAAWDLFAHAIESTTKSGELEWMIFRFALQSDQIDRTLAQVMSKLSQPPAATKDGGATK